MHFTELIRYEPREDQGFYYEQPVLVASIIEDSIRTGESLANSLEVLDAIVSLLRVQIQHRMRPSHNLLLASEDIRRLYEAYTKLGFRLQLTLPPMRFRGWEDFDIGFADNPTELDRKIYWQRELDWFDEPVRIIRDAIESGWSTELYASVDSGNRVGWPEVVLAMESLRRTYASANSPDEYANVSRNARGVLEKLSDAVWATGAYKTPENVEDGPQRIKNRLQTVIQSALEGAESKHLVALMKAAVEFADEVRHRRNPTRYEATIAADSALFLSNTLWLALNQS